MPAEEQVIIVITGKDAASKIFKSVGMEAGKAGKKVEKGLGDKLQKVGKNMTDVGKKMSIGLTAPLALFAGAAVNSAMKAERLQKTLDGLAGGAEGAARYINAIKDASQGTVPKVEALAIANRALTFGVVENADEMARLTEIAIALGRAQGLDAATAVSDLTTALSRQSPMILDNLGIVVKAGAANKAWAATHGVTVDAMTAEQKAIAFRTAALEAGMKVVDKMGGLQDDMASSSERLKAQMSDMSVTVGQALIPILKTALDVITPLVQAFTNASPAVQQMAVVIGAAAAAAGPLTSGIGALTTSIGGMMNAAGAAGGGLKGLSSALNTTGIQMIAVTAAFVAWGIAAKKAHELIQNIDQGMEDVAEATGTWTEEATGMISEGMSLSNVLDDLSARANETHDILNQDYSGGFLGLKGAIEDVGAAGIRTAKQSEILGQVAKDAEKAILANTSSWEEYIAAVDEWNAKAPTSEAMIQGMSAAQLDAAQSARAWVDGLVEQGRAMENAVQQAEQADQVMFNLAQRTMEARTETRSYNDILAEGTEGFRRSQQAILLQEEAMGSGAEMLEEFRAKQAATKEHNEQVAQAFGNLAVAAEESAARQVAAAAEAARGQADLISSMKDATQEMFNQQILAAVDPAEIGVEAWAGLGQELGLLDQTQVNLAIAAEELIGLYKDGAVPTENMAEATGALFTESQKLEPKFGAIFDKYSTMPEKISFTKDAMVEHHGIMSDMNDIMPDVAGGIDDVGSAMADSKGPTDDLKVSLDDVSDLLTELKGDHMINITTNYSEIGSPPGSPGGGGDRAQMGLRVPGPIGQPRVILAHGGEVVSNPYQYGAIGGPGGPPAPTNSYGGDTFNVNINDRMAAALFLDQMRRQRYDKLNARM